MRIIRHPDVLQELINLSYYIALENENAAHNFLDACEKTFEFLARHPLVGSQREFRKPHLQNVRLWPVKDFKKYLIFYRPLSDGVEILHVVHSARNYRRLFDED